jgi:hypothetical protein
MSGIPQLTHIDNGTKRACWSEATEGECGGARWVYRSSVTRQPRPLCQTHARLWVLEDLAVAVQEARTAADALATLNERVDALVELLQDVPE